MHHLTLLANAWFLSHDERYAQRVADQLRSWWRENPFLSGIHWTNGIEVGIRLISMVWIRRLLADWPGAAALFERDDLAVRQIRWHQQYLAAFRSRGSSANNHVIAEAAGQLVASCAFPWFPESNRWRRAATRLLERELIRNTFPSGVGRELASDYQCFVAELGLVAAIEAGASQHPLGPAVWARLCAVVDTTAALLDERMRPPRQGDGDEGRALLLDAPSRGGWRSLLAVGGRPARPAGLVARSRGRRGQRAHRRDGRSAAGRRGPASRAAVAVPRRRPHPVAHGTGRGAGDLVPVRWRPARIPQHRRARPRRCAVRGGPVRRCGHPRRPRYVLLSR